MEGVGSARKEDKMELGDERGSSSEMDSYSGSDDEFIPDEEMVETDGGDMTSQVKDFFSELDIDESKQKRRLLDQGLTVPRRKSILPHHLHSVMGSANLRLARGDSSGAIALCKEVIRQAPQASEPYLTLATIYEELQDEMKLFQIILIAAHLKRTDRDLWLKSASLAKKQMNPRIAVQCISRVITMEPKNIKLLWERASLYHDMKENKKAIEHFEELLKIIPSDAGEDYIEIAKELATLYHKMDSTPKAIEILGGILVRYPQLVDEETINILAELCILSKAYEQVYEVITGFYHMLPQPTLPAPDASAPELDLSSVNISDLSLTTALRISISGENMELGSDLVSTEEPFDPSEEKDLMLPSDVPVDLRVKLAIAMINLGKELPEKLLGPIFSSSEDYGDLYLDVADAYMANAEYNKGLPLLSALVGTSTYSQAGVWLKHADCQYMLNDLEGAAMSYSKVLSLAPNHTDTRLQLATLYVQMGLADDALMVLESDPNPQNEDEDILEPDKVSGVQSQVERDKVSKDAGATKINTQDIKLTLHKYRLLLSSGKLEDYVKAGCSLLAFLFRDVYKHPEMKVLVELKMKKKRVFRNVLASEGRREEMELENLLSPLEWFDLYVKTCKGLLKVGTPSSLYKVTYFIYCAVITMKFSGDMEKPFIFFSVSLSHIMKDIGTAFMLLRDLCYKDVENKHFWNIINLLPFDDLNRKFLLRLCRHKNSNSFVMRSLANSSLTSSSVNSRFCLSQFEREFREGGRRDYLLSLCIAIVYINSASQIKRPPNRNALFTMASGFLHTYIKLRGECQESMYNMGRAFHQLGLVHFACHFYKKVLVMEPECKIPEWTEASDLRSEAAFNLSLIYRASGNQVLARDMLRRYCTL